MSMHGIRESAGAGEWIMGAVTRNPEGLLLLAAGAALLMRSGRDQWRRRSYAEPVSESRGHREAPTGVGERVSEAARRAGDYVSQATDRMSETTRSYASSAADYADEAARMAAKGSRHVADQARETADYVVQEQPWAVTLVGLAAGAAVAAIFPPTHIEKRTLGDVGERLRSAAGTAGERVMEAGMQAGERLSEIAEDRGLTKEGLKQAAREVGETFSSALGEEAISPQNRQQPAETSPRTQTRQAQSGGTSTQSGKGGRSPGTSSGTTRPSGGRS
jgi:ElaB/YqjD/DUF883 family membrane-anchored ribosome-binding protein